MKRAVLLMGLLAALLALAQDVPVPCFPCEPDPLAGCGQCHTWGAR